MTPLRILVLSVLIILASSKKRGSDNTDSDTTETLKELLFSSMQSIVSLDHLVTDLSDKVARLTTAMSETNLEVNTLKSSVTSSLEELSSSLSVTREEIEQTRQDVEVLQNSGDLREVKEEVRQLTESLAKTEAKITGQEVTVVSGEEDVPGKCTKVCAGTTGRKSSEWSSGTNAVSITVDISECGFVKIPTVTTSIEGTGYHWRAIGTSAVYDTTTEQFTMYLAGGDNPGHDPANGKAAEWLWNVEWIAVGYSC